MGLGNEILLLQRRLLLRIALQVADVRCYQVRQRQTFPTGSPPSANFAINPFVRKWSAKALASVDCVWTGSDAGVSAKQVWNVERGKCRHGAV